MPVFESTTDEMTEALGRSLAGSLRGGDVIALHGDLGAGKTVMARGIARGLGIEEAVTSPTFALVQEYDGTALRFCHIDLYRLDTPDAAIAIGIDEYLNDERSVTAVEWAERLGNLCPKDAIEITISTTSGGRRIEIKSERQLDVSPP